MLKTIKHKAQGFAWGAIFATICWIAILYPHVQYNVNLTNEAQDLHAAEATATALSSIMPGTKHAK